jgi:hypothetical protein
MEIINLEYNNVPYNLHIVDSSNYDEYKYLLPKINICDPAYLDSSYELLSYSSIQDADNDFVGLFLTDANNSIAYVSMIVDLECNQYKEIILENGYSIDNSVELTLLCSNYKQRIAGLAKYTMNYVINNVLKIYKLKLKNIFLYVGKGIETNKIAYNFYIALGFKPLLDDHPDILIYTFSGGKNNKKLKKTKKYKRRYSRRFRYSNTRRTK